LFLIGRQITGIDIKGDKTPVENVQHGGYGLKLSGRISNKVNRSSLLFFEPFIKYWNLDCSDKKYYSFKKDKELKLVYM
jgi:hypothetical protein